MDLAARRTALALASIALPLFGALGCTALTQFLETSKAVEVTVVADQGWQSTAVEIAPGQRVTVEAVSGRWFEDPPGVWHDAGGGPNPWRCGDPRCHEPLPDFPKYALIGRIGQEGEALPIGERAEFVAESGGSLYLRPNYGDVDIPIHLPEGSIVVKVTVRGD